MATNFIEKKIRWICVYCGSSPGEDPIFVAQARHVGKTLAQSGIGIVYGGGRYGLMGMLADASLEAGGKVIGVIPRALVAERAHQGLTELRVVGSMHERKALMAELSDAFIALPGGIGTLEELFEVWTWGQLGFHYKPCGLLNSGGYYRLLEQFLNHAAGQGFLLSEHRQMLLSADSIEELLPRLATYSPPEVEKWIGSEET
jgi:uncharacterized protein (TIGR00730 family)